MEIKKFGHIAFNCKDLERSIAFYQDVLGCREVFRLTYDSMLEEMKSRVPSGLIGRIFDRWIEKQKDRTWLVYLELADGIFIELFDQIGAKKTNVPTYRNYNYQHFALIVDDIYKVKKELIAKGIKPDNDITFGPDHTYQMWLHDPDGNKFEVMQYTDQSLQIKAEHIN